MRKKELTTFSKVCISIVCITMVILFATGVATRSFCKGIVLIGERYNTAKTEQMFDVTALSNWCGEPIGKIKMLSGTVNETLDGNRSIIIDEEGHKWLIDSLLNKENFYLLWIDDMGTEEIKDDEIIKVWREER